MSEYFSLAAVKQELRAQNGGAIPNGAFIIEKAVGEEVRRLQEMLYLVVGETRAIDEEVFEFCAWDVLGAFGRLVFEGRRPIRLTLAKRNRKPAWALPFLVWSWEEFATNEPLDLDVMV